ncbi:MAG: indolepyruvate oxidoreductase subunit beta family protein [Pseudomonadota bacterium]|nr:indolepyruvate oxidoreductase subunit beta family protein [Pseudomonadota bacterium]
MGGEGGGVLADWIVDLAEHNGHLAQSTSVPGVAQRTGATIYYVELFPVEAARAAGATPVLALMPLPGDVDVVLASELMEAGRAVQRGLVTTDRTTFIASTNRVYSITEKTAMGDGRVDAAALLAHAREAAARFVGFDMAAVADAEGSVISAVLFGALAGTGVLPFARSAFEATIGRGGVGVEGSRRAFEAGFREVSGSASIASPPPLASAPIDPVASPPPEITALLERMRAEVPAGAHRIVGEGIRRSIDWQDPEHATLYLDRLMRVQGKAGATTELIAETARHLALWMSYEDVIRVAALKTRATRFERVHGETKVAGDQLMAIDEYLHPRLQEIAETLPASLGRWLERPGWPRRVVERFTQRGRVVTTSSLGGFMLLYAIAGLRRFRRSSLRFAVENERIDRWLDRVVGATAHSPALALEVARCQRLVKGYGDTHARGWANFSTLMDIVEKRGAGLAPAALGGLCDAALADEHGDALHAALLRTDVASKVEATAADAVAA